jgi:rhodanese-related sulfurtransferase
MIMFKKSLALAALCLCSLATRADIVNIDNAELSRLAAEGVPVIDIRTEAEWKSTGVIAGSKLITFFDASGNANPPQWLEQAKSVARPDQPVILICRSGNRTKAATRFLAEQAGYTKVYNVSRGLNGWIGAGQPLAPWHQ